MKKIKPIWIMIGIVALVVFMSQQEKKVSSYMKFYNTLDECNQDRDNQQNMPCLGECVLIDTAKSQCMGSIPMVENPENKYTYISDNAINCENLDTVSRGWWNCLYGFELKNPSSKWYWTAIIALIILVGILGYTTWRGYK